MKHDRRSTTPSVSPKMRQFVFFYWSGATPDPSSTPIRGLTWLKNDCPPWTAGGGQHITKPGRSPVPRGDGAAQPHAPPRQKKSRVCRIERSSIDIVLNELLVAR